MFKKQVQREVPVKDGERERDRERTHCITAQDRCYCVPQGSEKEKGRKDVRKKGHLKTCFDSHTFLHSQSSRTITF